MMSAVGSEEGGAGRGVLYGAARPWTCGPRRQDSPVALVAYQLACAQWESYRLQVMQGFAIVATPP